MAADDAESLIEDLRAQILDNDRAIVAAINTRLTLVARLKQLKEGHGVAFVDPAREQWLLEELGRENEGPLTGDGLGHIYAELLALTKRELAPRDD